MVKAGEFPSPEVPAAFDGPLASGLFFSCYSSPNPSLIAQPSAFSPAGRPCALEHEVRARDVADAWRFLPAKCHEAETHLQPEA